MNKTKKTRERLKLLKCPYLEGLEEQVVHELLLSESEARLRVIKWLLGKAHPAIQKSVSALSAVKSEIGITARLTELLSILGVCSANDYDIVKGSTPLFKQVKFLEALTGAIVSYSSFEDGPSDHWDSQNKSTNQSCDFLESLIMSENLSDVLKSDIMLIPADISHVTGINQDTLETIKVPSVSELKRQVNEQETATVELQLLLDKLSDQCSYVPLNSSTVAGCSNAIKVSLDTTIQLMDDFVRCYHDDIKPWTNEEPCQLGCLGNASKQVHSLLLIVNELLDSSMRLEDVSHKWEKIIDKKSIRENNTSLLQCVQTVLKVQSTAVNE